MYLFFIYFATLNMIIMKYFAAIIFSLCCIPFTGHAQQNAAYETDSLADSLTVKKEDSQDFLERFKEKRKRKSEKNKDKNFHYNILAGPSYSPDFGFLIGGSMLMTFRIDKNDTTLKRSVMPFSIAAGMKGVNIALKPQLFFKNDKYRLFGEFKYKINNENYYGVGYETNKTTLRGPSTTLYNNRCLQINPYFLFRLTDKREFFIGPQIDMAYDKIVNPSEGVVNDPDYQADLRGKTEYSNFSVGLGLVANYDSRDVPANAYKGVFMELRAAAYSKIFGSNTTFYKVDLDYRQYHDFGKRKILAWTLQSKNVMGDVPITRLSIPGTPFDLRGYYMGQYRDKSSHIAIVEYRQMFSSEKSNIWGNIIRHLGWTVWGGCGFMGPTPVNIEGLLPNAGIGLRIEVQPRMNIRLDFGRNFINKQNLFYFNITEAF